MHRHQLHGGHAQPGQVVDDDRAGQARIGAALPGRDPGMAQGQAADMRLVDHRLVIRPPRRPVIRPVEVRVSHDIARHEGGAVAGADRLRRADPVGEQGLVPLHLTRDGLAIRVEQQLRRIAPVTAVWRVRAVHAIPVVLTRADARQVAVPDETVHLGQPDPPLPAVTRTEQAQLHPVGHFREQGKIGPRPIPGSTKRISTARPDAHSLTLPPRPPKQARRARPGGITDFMRGLAPRWLVVAALIVGRAGVSPDMAGARPGYSPSFFTTTLPSMIISPR